jgi:cytochrome c biogenesis protein CcdA
MSLLLLSFLSGILTVFAPCAVFVLVTSVACAVAKTRPGHVSALIGSFALAWTVFVFSASVIPSFHVIPVPVWRALSGGLLASVGLILAFPRLRSFFQVRRSGEDVHSTAAYRERLAIGSLTGVSLGIGFATGFPLRANIAVDMLAREPVSGLTILLLFILGFAFTLLFVAVLAQTILRHFVLSRPQSPFRRFVGVFFLIVAVVFALGWDSPVESWLVSQGWDRITPVERALSEHRLEMS